MQILGDPEAADLVFGCGAPIKVIGLDVTRNILMTGKISKCNVACPPPPV
jgi:inosine-uridine nucleoside N-ribohydrolase